jgi:hypothetical protein
MNIAHYTKFLAAIVFVVISALVAALADNSITVEEGINVGIVGLGAIGTYLAPNLPQIIGGYLKLVVQALTAGAVLLVTLLVGGVTIGELLQVGAAVLGVFVVYALPNFPEVVKVTAAGDVKLATASVVGRS